MAATVQSALPTEDFGTSPRTFSLGSAVASGNSVVVFVITGADSGGVDVTVTDNQSNTYTQIYDTLNVNDEQVLCFRANNITNGPTSLSVQWTGGGSRFVGIGYVEASGLGSFISGARQRTVFTEAVSTTIDTTGNANAYGVGVVTSAGKDITPSSGFSRTPATGTAFNHLIFDDDMGAGGTKTYGGTWTGQGNETANVIALAFQNAAGSAPSITSVSDATIEPGQTGVVITGTGFSASGNTVKISPTNNVNDVNAVTQTITAQGTTSITFTGVRGSLNFETGAFLFVTNNSAQSNASGTSVQFVARPYVRENLISETGAAVASETGITMVVYHSVPTTGSPNPAQVITGVASNGTGAIDVQIARGSLALNAPVWVVLMKDGSPAKGTVRKVTPVYE